MGRLNSGNLTGPSDVKRAAFVRLILSVVFMGMMLFLPAGTLDYWEAWLFLIVLFTPVLLVFRYLLHNDPDLLKKRLQTHESDPSHRTFMGISVASLLIAFMLPGLDHRFNWSEVPVLIVIMADIAVLVGYYLFFLVLRENSYASRIIEVSENQKVISTGPYSVIRHPMYFSILIIYIFSPLALGSYWASLALAIITPGILIYRIHYEEKVLIKELPGYEAYTREVEWRLIRHFW